MEQFAQSVAEGVRAQTLKTYLTTRMDKDAPIRKSPRAHKNEELLNFQGDAEIHHPIRPTPPPQESRPVHRKIKDPHLMQQILDRERSKLQKRPEIQKSYALEPPPFATSYTNPVVTFPEAKNDPQFSYSISGKDKTDYSGTRPFDNSINPGGPLTGLITRERKNYATEYGYKPARLPYEDEVDVMAENQNRYQELSHWQSSLEKPTEENLEALKKVNHERLSQLHTKFKQNKCEAEELDRLRQGRAFDSQFIKHSVVESRKLKSSLSPGKRAQYGKDFEDYLKHKRNDQARSRGDFNFMVDFDRYECTSPDPKRIHKDHSLLFKENV